MTTRTLTRIERLALTGFAALGFAALLALLAADPSHAALKGMAGYGDASAAHTFGSISRYLNNIRDALIPLAVPAAGIGLAAGGVMHFIGHQMASKLLMGVLVGLVLVLTAPSIVA